MDLLQAVILGIIQGATETLPISSSAHLLLTPWLLGWQQHSLTFDVALHGGTAIAIIVYFWRDWVVLATSFLGSIRDLGSNKEPNSRPALATSFLGSIRDLDFDKDPNSRLAWYIVIASIPGAVAGILLESTVEEALRTPWLVAILLMAMGLVLLLADRTSTHRRGISELTLRDAVIIGVSQAFALIPGVSRSGITITTALFRQIGRRDAARFSFLLSGPIVTGAFLYKMAKLAREGFPQDERLPFLAGILAAAVVGYIAIKFLLSYLQTRSLNIFVYYRLALGAVVLLVFLLR